MPPNSYASILQSTPPPIPWQSLSSITIILLFPECHINRIIQYAVFFKIIKYREHKMHHFKVYNSVTLSTFTVLCNHHHYLVLQQFCYPSKILHVHWQLTPVSYPPVPDQPVICFPSLIGLPFLDISYKWNHAKLVFCVWLLSISMKFIHVVAYISFSFLFIAEEYSIVQMYHILFIH